MLRLVLLPGMDGTGRLFNPLLAALPPSMPTTVVRYPGEAASYDALTAYAVQALPKDAPYVLLGESVSGPVAIRLASMHPPGLRGVILCATFARSPSRWLSRLAPAVHLIPPMPPPLALLRRLLCHGARADAHTLALLASAVASISPKVLLQRLREVAAVDVSAPLMAVHSPMMYLRARHDRLVPAAAFDHLQSIQPDLQLAEFDAPHLLLQTVPEEAAAVICAFMEAGAPFAASPPPPCPAAPPSTSTPTPPNSPVS
ncbi:alpha/beta fold hydrolase [Roseateles terrae]|uniref:Pimeloyl-ACP methyl ester carboxylesterase n=1 Tax=Roseateles terrae TaxID=431060 RepID=A0ABR6GT51_9BURK|nr:alpha/beta hydrolase [Roseateles terrae]MBB3195290.1 pimeloyl-ACP methyl ester carboxylesterase [Roseateles terrae]